MYKAIIFDFDGTLVDTLPLYVEAYRDALEKFEFHFEDRKIAETCFGKKEENICANLNISDKVDEFRRLYFQGVEEQFENVKLFDDAFDTLAVLKKRNFDCAVVTFAYRWYIEKMIKKMGIENYFKVVVSNEDVRNPKPNPDAVLVVCNKFKCSPKEAVIIGDSKSDILMGKNAGSTTVLFAPKHHEVYYDFKKLFQCKPNFIIKKLGELKNIIL